LQQEVGCKFSYSRYPFSLPDDPEVFVHRSGRTGRAGKDGISMALIKPEESRKLNRSNLLQN
jgi:superfamily II DNA/RNA helicase